MSRVIASQPHFAPITNEIYDELDDILNDIAPEVTDAWIGQSEPALLEKLEPGPK